MSRHHTIGFECELDGTDISLLIDEMINRNLWHDAHQGDRPGAHYNHCACEACTFGDAFSSPYRAHIDSSCDGEIVSDIFPWPSTYTEMRINQLATLLADFNAKPGDRAGFHVHVGHDLPYPYDDEAECYCECEDWDDCTCNLDYQPSSMSADAQAVIDYFTWYEPQIAVYAKQSAPCVRRYNTWLSTASRTQHIGIYDPTTFIKHNSPPTKGDTLALRENTWEFRIWNSVTEAWRMHMAIEISCAFLDAVADAPEIGTRPNSERPALLTFIAPYLSDAGLAYIARHLATPADS